MGVVYIGRKLPCKVLCTRPWFDLVPFMEFTGALVARLDDTTWAIYRWGNKPGWTIVPEGQWTKYSQTNQPDLPHQGWAIIDGMVTAGGQTCMYTMTQEGALDMLVRLVHNHGHYHLPLFHVPREERVYTGV